jgi:hypothetical protein
LFSHKKGTSTSEVGKELITKQEIDQNYNKASGHVSVNRPSEGTYRVAGSKDDSENFETGDVGAAVG